jgi:hypothetical protein
MSLDINLTNVQSKAVVVSTNQTAVIDASYTVVANATFTDPTPVEGKGYRVFVRNGTATINSVAYTVGTSILRLFHSGAWVSYVSLPDSNFVPTTRTINGYDLSANRTLTASDVGAVATNSAITGATKTKVTFDAKGLVTSGADATPSDFGMFLYKQPVHSANVTGTIETIVNSVDVGNGKFSADDVMNIDSCFVKIGGLGQYTLKYYLSTVDNNITVNAILVAQALASANSLYVPTFPRFLTIHDGNVNGFPSSIAALVPVNSSTARLNILRNFASDMFLITTIQNANGADVSFLQSQIIKNF